MEIFTYKGIRNGILAFALISAIIYFFNDFFWIFWPGDIDAAIGALIGGFVASRDLNLHGDSVKPGLTVGLVGGLLYAIIETTMDVVLFYESYDLFYNVILNGFFSVVIGIVCAFVVFYLLTRGEH
ncbi:MAG: hypothetical protein ACFFCZ_09370 [Promethearchaeota archaeon]